MNSLNIENFDKKTSGKTILICPDSNSNVTKQAKFNRIEEAKQLASAIDLDVFEIIHIINKNIKPSHYFGKGFVDKIKNIINLNHIDLIISDSPLSPIQQRNLELSWDVKVIDRTGLILEIFGKRAKTREGILQVDLAHLNYQKTRLVRSWTHLERQRGGAGFLGGPGEKQIEIDRRIINNKINKITKDIEKVKKTRKLHRDARKKIPYPLVALVGYTNAGKSTLFNKLTNSNVYAKDKLFATLDPTMRVMKLPSGLDIIISDTVGFISELPHELIASFRATLEEVLEADIIINVRDISNPDNHNHNSDVLNILNTLLDNNQKRTKILDIFTKVDLVEAEQLVSIDLNKNTNLKYVSSYSGYGIDLLKEYIDKIISREKKRISISVSLSDGKTLAWLYQNGQIISRTDNNKESTIELFLTDKDINILEIGSFEGMSVLFFDKYLKIKNLYSVDLEKNENFFHNIKELKNIKFFNMTSNNFFKKKLDICFDIIYIDGSHYYIDVFNDLINSDLLLKKDGILLIDDLLLDVGIRKKGYKFYEEVMGGIFLFLKKKKNYKFLYTGHQLILKKN